MRTGALTRGTTPVSYTQIALGRFGDRLHFLVYDQLAARVPDLDHANGIVGAVPVTRFAANARSGIDAHLAGKRFTVNRTGGAANHTHRVSAVHAGIGDHQPPHARTVAQEAGVVVVGGGARAHTIVAARAAVEVDQHGRGAVKEAVLRQKLQNVSSDLVTRGLFRQRIRSELHF